MRTVGADTAAQLETVDLFISHEGLLLEYEQSLTRRLRHPGAHAHSSDSDGKGWYNTSAHFLWIGDRTRQLDGAHVEYFRGLENPIGIKVGPSMEGDELVRLLDIVNPKKEVGKVTLITRYGEKNVEDMLGPHIEAVKASGHVVIWQCDPMHGYALQGVSTLFLQAIRLTLDIEIPAQHQLASRHASFRPFSQRFPLHCVSIWIMALSLAVYTWNSLAML